MNKAFDVLTRDIAILLYLGIGWSVPILKGGRFDVLIQQAHLTDLAVLLLIWLGYYALHYIQTGDWTAPAPAAAARLSLDDLEQLGSALARHSSGITTGDCERISAAVVNALTPIIRPPLPQQPPQGPPLPGTDTAIVIGALPVRL